MRVVQATEKNFERVTKGGAYLDVRHGDGKDFLEGLDKLLKPHGLQLVCVDVDDGYVVRVEKRKAVKR